MSDIGWVADDNPVLKQIDDAAMRYGVDRNLAHVVAQMESSYNPDAASHAGAQGVMQLMPATAASLGVHHPFDSSENIDGGVRLLSSLLRKYGGDTRLTLAAYNAGEPAVDRAKGVPNFPETQNYVKTGLSILYPRLAQTAAPVSTDDIGWVPDAPAPAPPAELSPLEKAGKAFSEGLGIPLLLDIIRASNRYGTPQDVAARGVRAMNALKGIGQGILNEPGRIKGELDQFTGASDPLQALYHAAGAVPFLGAGVQQVVQDIGRGDPAAAVGHTGALVAPFVAGPAADLAGQGIEATGRGLATAGTMARGAASGMAEAVPDAAAAALEKSIYGAIGGPKGMLAAGATGAARELGKGAVKGVKAALAERATQAAAGAAEEAAPAAAAAPPLALPPGPVITPPPADTSGVTAVTGQYATPEQGFTAPASTPGTTTTPWPLPPKVPIPDELLNDLSVRLNKGKKFARATDTEQASVRDLADRLLNPAHYQQAAAPRPPAAPAAPPFQPRAFLPAAPNVITPEAPPPPPDTSFVRSVPAELPQIIPEPLRTKPAAMDVAAQLEASMRVDTLTDYLTRNKVPSTMLDNFGDKQWKMVADQAGVQPPTPENVEAIRSNLAQYEGANQITANTPADAAAEFQQKTAVRGKRKGPAQAAAPVPPPPPVAPPATQSLADIMAGTPQTEMEGQLADSIRAVQAGERPAAPAAPEGPQPATASEHRVEALAQHLAADKTIASANLASLPSDEGALLQLEKLGESLGINGRPAPGEPQQIVDRALELRGEGPEGTPAGSEPGGASTEPGVGDLLSRPDDVANAALERMRKRGTFSGEKLNAGVDPEDIKDMGLWGAAKLVKGAQRIIGGLTEFGPWAEQMAREFGQAIIPHLDNIWQQSKALADRVSKDVKRRSMGDLDVRMPDEGRVVSPDPTKTIDGQPFHSLDLAKPSEGFLPLRNMGEDQANAVINGAWQKAIKDSEAGGGSTAADAVKETGAKVPDAQFWDKSFSLPQRARYWYELSGEGFTKKFMDLPRDMQPAFIDNVASTSGGAEPYRNLQRAIGVTAEDLQRHPIMTDLRDPVSVRNALDRQSEAMQSLKYKSFSGTMQYTSGLTDKPPLSTNDVQVASMFGLDGSDYGKNPILYEVTSRFFQNLRDAQNAELPGGAQPWETWQMQAPSWVYERIRKNPAKAAEYDDYAQVFPRVISNLQAAGIPTPGGKITPETLMDPRTPSVMSGTRSHFLQTPVATVETATRRTAEGAAAADLHAQLQNLDPSIPWVRNASERYEQIQRNTMREIASRQGSEPSLISQLMSGIVGRKVDVSRLDWTGYGTFDREISPNLRIPMTGRAGQDFISLTKPQREVFLSTLGQDLNQEAMASSHFDTVPHGGSPDTYSVFLTRYDGVVDKPKLEQFGKQIGFPVNVSQYPNGTLVDINIGGFEKQPRPTLDQVVNLAAETFGDDPNVKQVGPIARSYASDYVTRQQYNRKINAYARTVEEGQAAQPGGSRQARSAADLRSNIPGVRKAIQDAARKRDADFADWTQSTGQRLQQHLSRPQTLKEIMQPQ